MFDRSACFLSSRTLHLFHNPQEIASPDHLDFFFAVTFVQQPAGEIDHFRRVVAADDAAIAVEITADTYMLYADEVDHVVKMVDGIADGCRAV